MASVPNNGGGPPPGWYPPPYSHSYHHHHQSQPPPPQYAPHHQQHSMYGGPVPPPPPPPPPHQQQYPMGPQQPPYHHNQGYPGDYPPIPSSMSSGSTGSNGYPPAPTYSEHHYPGMGPNSMTNPNPHYQHHQTAYSHPHHYSYGGLHQLPPPESHHKPPQGSADRSTSSDSRDTPNSAEHDRRASATPYHQHPHYASYAPPSSGGPSAHGSQSGNGPAQSYSYSQNSYQNQQQQQQQQQPMQTPRYPGPPSSSHNPSMSSLMKYPVGTPGLPTPPPAPTPGSAAASGQPYPGGGYSNTPGGNNNNNNNMSLSQPYHQHYYQGNQHQYPPPQNHSAASFPAPPPFPYQQKRAVPPPPSTAATSHLHHGAPTTCEVDKNETPEEPADPKEKSLAGAKRRFSFGSQATTKISNCTSFENKASNSKEETRESKEEEEEDGIPAPPLPPQSAPPKFRSDRKSKYSEPNDSEGTSKSPPGPLQESSRQNSMLSKFEENRTDSADNVPVKNEPKSEASAAALMTAKKSKPNGNAKTPSFDDASLLLGLRTNSNNNSPETVPATVSHDSHEEEHQQHKHREHPQLRDSGSNHNMQYSDQSLRQGTPVNHLSSTKMQVERSPNVDEGDEPSLTYMAAAPNTNNMVPLNYPKRLALPNDAVKLNSLHCFIRTELLEIFVIEPSALKNTKHIYAPSSSVGRVGLRCVYCAMARRRFQSSCTKVEEAKVESKPTETEEGKANENSKVENAAKDTIGRTEPTDGANIPLDDEAPMAVFYPKSVAEIYRLVTSWQRCHLRKCRNVPADIRSAWNELRESDKSRGKTAYWVASAQELGLVDCTSRAGGIRFRISKSGPTEKSPKIKQEDRTTASEATESHTISPTKAHGAPNGTEV